MDKGWQVAPNATRKEKEQGQMLAETQLMSHLASAFSVFSLAFLAVPLAVRVGRPRRSSTRPSPSASPSPIIC